MRDFVSCYSDHAVKVSDSSCSGSAGSVVPPSSSRGVGGAPAAARTAVTCAYRARVASSGREFVVRVIWSKPLIGQGFSISVDGSSGGGSGSGSGSVEGSGKDGYGEAEEDEDRAACASSGPCSPSDPLMVTKRKGSRYYRSADGATVGLHWDLSSARYALYGPEPVESFYLAVVIESELCVLLGDQSKKLEQQQQMQRPLWSSVAARCVLLSRREHVAVPPTASLGPYTTKARFREGAREHEVSIKWGEPPAPISKSAAGTKVRGAPPDLGELAVFVDRKKVVHVRRLRWNFRGNQTIFVDGAPVDMMWDVYGWWFGGGGGGGVGGSAGGAVFMFRARSALESRLWLEEDPLSGELGDKGGSSLVIHANKSL